MENNNIITQIEIDIIEDLKYRKGFEDENDIIVTLLLMNKLNTLDKFWKYLQNNKKEDFEVVFQEAMSYIRIS